jgi:hypothetical protein
MLLRFHHPVILLLGIFLISSCQKEDQYSIEEQSSILMSTGWKLDRLILHFQDNRKDEESDTLVLLTLRSDTEKQQMTVYTERWIVFENDTLGLTAFNMDYYSRPDDQADWESTGKNNAGVGWTDWGFDAKGIPHLSILKERSIRIRMVSVNKFILEDAYRIETTEDILSGTATRTYLFGDYPPGTLERIDAVYLAAGVDEGPNWFPTWYYWPVGFVNRGF